MWNVSEELGTVLPVQVDTLFHRFQNTNLVEGVKGHYNYLGNLGAPVYHVFSLSGRKRQSLCS